MGSMRQRGKVLETVALVMLEEGKVLNKKDYEQMETRTPVRAGIILNHFGSWSRMLGIMQNSLPEVWAQIKLKENPPPKPKPAPPKVPKPAPKPVPEAAVKPAPAVKLEK